MTASPPLPRTRPAQVTPVALVLGLLLLVPLPSRATPAQRKALKAARAQLVAAEALVAEGEERWCRDEQVASEVEAAAFRSVETARVTSEDAREGTALHEEALGDEGVGPQARALSEELRRCVAREAAA
ncbi:MAG: hypothetical protein KDA24_28350, partial [Deltaproteobacteria bacterium]|nr:hypothetical protein [Deltaproteobacteria bacterium]